MFKFFKEKKNKKKVAKILVDFQEFLKKELLFEKMTKKVKDAAISNSRSFLLHAGCNDPIIITINRKKTSLFIRYSFSYKDKFYNGEIIIQPTEEK